ncbi:MAG: ABC transporter substrate-binding protein, partial [Phycisphaerales bacterium]|nr:ABC transporter substrate-binding protein [Phycisphaerales bacterium]
MTHLLRLGHSPDPDDAFMWWPLTAADGPFIDPGPYRFEAVLDDIESLNARAESGELEITALSCAQTPRVQDRYVLTSCGASVGDGYGPKLVARRPMTLEEVGQVTIAVPGERTSAFGGLCLMLGRNAFRYEVVPFDQIIDVVAEGRCEAGLVIHEGQLTFADAGLHLIEDLGVWWRRRSGQLLPLGVNA